MRLKLYQWLVNRHAGIRSRYHRYHDGAVGAPRFRSWLYLFWLNFCYYFLGCRFLDKEKEAAAYEEKKLPIGCSESELQMRERQSVDQVVERLLAYDVISFDIFDTLLFRPFSEPSDVFYFMGDVFEVMDLKRIRMEQEEEARIIHAGAGGGREISLRDIWKQMERAVGIPAEKGMETELALERRFCYANPFMLQVVNRLYDKGKKMIAVSDMYLPGTFLGKLLTENGYKGIGEVYVSCEYGCGKGDGGLFRIAMSAQPEGAGIIHVGDNPASDIKMAERYGLHTMYYPNVNRKAHCYRAYDMSPVIGGAYRGIVDAHLYSGLETFSPEYEYGYVYGGLFVVGYCAFIHDYCRGHHIEKVLFLSRDGDILKQAYDLLYPGSDTEYVYWSRKAAVKLAACFDRYDYFRRFLFHKQNLNFTVREVLDAMEIGFLEGTAGLGPEEVLTEKNAPLLRQAIEAEWEQVLRVYEEQDCAAKRYYGKVLEGVGKAAAVDIGWAGSGAMTLRQLVSRKWKLPCEVVGMIAGTNTIHNAEPDASESFLQSGKLVAYLYSQSHNRDLLKKHDPNKDYNVFWELLLSSPTPQFQGFYPGRKQAGCLSLYREDLDITLKFGKYDENQSGICQIQKGILDFVREYHGHFKDLPCMFRISGRDAYAPMLLAAGRGEKYLKEMEKKFHFEVTV